jgi:hypothetical protein
MSELLTPQFWRQAARNAFTLTAAERKEIREKLCQTIGVGAGIVVLAIVAVGYSDYSDKTNDHALKVCMAEQGISGHATPECVHVLAEAAVAKDEADAARHKAECAQPYPANEPGQDPKKMSQAQLNRFLDCR